MNFNSKQIIEIVSAAAIVVSLIFVAAEIRQNNQISQATMEFELRRDFASLNDLRLNDEAFAAFSVKMEDPNYEMTAIERERAFSFAMRIANVWGSVQEAYDSGLLSDTSYQGMIRQEVPRVLEKYPAMLPFFKEIWRYPDGTLDNPELGAYVNQTIRGLYDE